MAQNVAQTLAISPSAANPAAALPSGAALRLPPSQDLPRPNGMSELELLRTITSGITSFGNAVRLSGLSHAQRSRVLAHLADASTRMMEATNAYLFELARIERVATPASEPDTAPVRPRRPLRGRAQPVRRTV